MSGGPSEKRHHSRQKVVHISRARTSLTLRPLTDPPRRVNAIWATRVPEMDRAKHAEIDMRIDLRRGDPFLWLLCKARYIIENITDAFKDEEAREEAVVRTVRMIRDYGQVEGIHILRQALELHGGRRRVREAVSNALARMGLEDDCGTMLSLLHTDAETPEYHLRALVDFADRYPETADMILGVLAQYPPTEPFRKAMEDIRS